MAAKENDIGIAARPRDVGAVEAERENQFALVNGLVGVGELEVALRAGGRDRAKVSGALRRRSNLWRIAWEYALVFGFNAAGMIAVSQLNLWLVGRMSLRGVLAAGFAINTDAGLLLVAAVATGWGGCPC